MYPFDLKGGKIHIESAPVYESSRWESKQIGELSDEIIVVRSIILATRTRKTVRQQPYIYIEKDPASAVGIWLNEADYSVIPAENTEGT